MQVLDRAGVGTLWSICKTKFALAGHTHNYAGSGSAGGSANSAVSVVDYGQTSKTIQIGYGGSGITGDQIKYIAGYTTGGGDVNAKIKDVSKDALRSWLGLGSLAYSSTTLGNAAGKNVRTLGSVSHSSWANATTDDLYVPTMSFIAYWNGAYNSSGNSNLQYCSRGKFGALAVKDTADWSQVTNKPATATRWPSWGEVTGKPELKNWSDTKAYIDSKFSLASGVKRIINIDFISTRAPELIYDHTDTNFRLCDAIRGWNGSTILCTVYNKKIYYGFPYTYNHDSDNPQWIKNAFSDKSYATIDPRGEFYHGVVDSDTILNLHGTFYNADLQQCDSNGNVLA